MKLILILIFSNMSWAEPSEIKIAFWGDYNGVVVPRMKESKAFIKKWNNENKSISNRKISIRYFYDNCNPNRALAEWNYLISWNPDLIIGPTCSSIVETMGKLFDLTDISIISPSVLSEKVMLNGYTNFFRFQISDIDIFGKYIEKFSHHKKIVFLHDGSLFGRRIISNEKTNIAHSTISLLGESVKNF